MRCVVVGDPADMLPRCRRKLQARGVPPLEFASGLAHAAADRLLTLKSHTDAMEMMGQKTPAQDENYLYWFGGDAIRHDTGKVSTILRFDRKQMIWINHDDKTYSVIDLPIDFRKLFYAFQPPGVKAVAGGHDLHSLPGCLSGDLGQVHVRRDGHGVAGMDVKI